MVLAGGNGGRLPSSFTPQILEEARLSTSSFQSSSSAGSKKNLAPGGSTAVSRSSTLRVRQSLRAPSESKARQKARTQVRRESDVFEYEVYVQ